MTEEYHLLLSRTCDNSLEYLSSKDGDLGIRRPTGIISSTEG